MLNLKNKGASSVALVIIIIVVAVLIGGVWYLQTLKTEEPALAGEGVRDCGVNDKMNDVKNLDALKDDSVLTCFGESITACEDAKVVFEDVYRGPVLFEISSEECMAKMSLGSADQIVRESDKKYAGKYIECPIDNLKGTLGVDPSKITESGWGFNFYWVLGNIAFSSDENVKAQAKSIGCTGTFLE